MFIQCNEIQMDAFKPLLNNIIRLEVSHKPMFYIAGVKDSKIDELKLQKAKKNHDKKSSQTNNDEIEAEQTDSSSKNSRHLDVWA